MLQNAFEMFRAIHALPVHHELFIVLLLVSFCFDFERKGFLIRVIVALHLNVFQASQETHIKGAGVKPNALRVSQWDRGRIQVYEEEEKEERSSRGRGICMRWKI